MITFVQLWLFLKYSINKVELRCFHTLYRLNKQEIIYNSGALEIMVHRVYFIIFGLSQAVCFLLLLIKILSYEATGVV